MLLNYNKKIQRIVKILEEMIVGDGWIAIKHLADVNECTERTIYNDVNYLVKHWGQMIPLDISHTHIVYSKSSVGNIQYARERILADQKITQLMRLIIENPLQSIEYYSDQIDLSVQSTRYLLADLEASLRLYDLGLNTKTRHIHVFGDELKVRYFCATFYYLFQRSFQLESVMVSHGITVSHYMKGHLILSYTLKILEQISVLRFNQGFEMPNDIQKWNLENDVNATLLQFIDELRAEGERIMAYDHELLEIIHNLGYRVDIHDRDKICMVLALIIFMYEHIFRVKHVRVNSAVLFIINYSKVNCERYKKNEVSLLNIFSNFTDNASAILSAFLFVLDAIFPLNNERISGRYAIFSNSSVDHGKALARYMDTYFPNNRYIVYDGKTELQIPSKDDLQEFCTANQCMGLISTISLPYTLNIPILTVSDYFVGSDIGRIFDFINVTSKVETRN